MTECSLQRIGADRLVTGDLSAQEASELEAHLTSDCRRCEEVLTHAGLDEETLLMVLLAARQAQPTAAELDPLWQRVEQGLPAARDAAAGPAEVVPLRPIKRRFFTAGLAAAGAAAAVVLLMVVPRGDPVDAPYDGIKGTAELTGGVLALQPAGPFRDGDTVRLTYRSERELYLTVVRARLPAGGPTILFNARAPAATAGNGRFPVGGGHLGYRFENEPGEHLFVLLTSARPLDPERIQAIFAAVATQPEKRLHSFDMEGMGVAVQANKVEVAAAP